MIKATKFGLIKVFPLVDQIGIICRPYPLLRYTTKSSSDNELSVSRSSIVLWCRRFQRPILQYSSRVYTTVAGTSFPIGDLDNPTTSTTWPSSSVMMSKPCLDNRSSKPDNLNYRPSMKTDELRSKQPVIIDLNTHKRPYKEPYGWKSLKRKTNLSKWGPPNFKPEKLAALVRKPLPARLIIMHRRGLCLRLLSRGPSSQAIANQWRGMSDVVRLSLLGAYLASTNRHRILLRILQVYGSSEEFHKWWCERDASSKILIGCIDNLGNHYREGKISLKSAQVRAQQIVGILTSMNQIPLGYGVNPVQIGAKRIRILMSFLPAESAFQLYQTLLNSKIDISEGIHLTAMHVFVNAGMFVEAIQIFQKLALLPILKDHSTLPRIWQFRRLFYKLYRAGVPIHQSDILGFLSSLGVIDPQIYKLILYAATGVNDMNMAAKLSREYETRTGVEMPLDAATSVFLMFRRLGDIEGLKRVYQIVERRGLQPLSNSFFVTAVLLVEGQKLGVDYWQLYALYRRFFKVSPLIAVGLPLPKQAELIPSANEPLDPTIGTLTIMLHSYVRTVTGKVEGSRHALKVYEKYIELLKRQSQFPQFKKANEPFLAIIVSAIGKYKSNLGLALGVVQDMIDLKYLPTPTSLTWDHLLRVSTEHGDVAISEKIWAAMLEHGISPTSYTYNAMIVLYATVGEEDKAGILRARMVREGWPTTQPTQYAFDIALNKKKWMEAFDAEMASYGTDSISDKYRDVTNTPFGRHSSIV